MNNDLMFSSRHQAWDTPQAFFNAQNEIYHFDLDVCATKENAKCKRFFSPEDDGLKQSWSGICWMNPPYGRQVGVWVRKAKEEAVGQTTVVALLPARTDTQWFHSYIYDKPRVECEFIKGRLVFGSDNYWEWLWSQETIDGKPNSLFGKIGKKNSAPFPSMLVIFNR